jgi:hypothetical protein
MMKRILYFLVSFLVVSALFQSCGKEEEFNEKLLIGNWKPISGTRMYFRYNPNGTGVTWNPDEDYGPDDGKKFIWKLEKTELEQRHNIEIIDEDIIIRLYTVSELNETTLRYRDDFGSYSFTRMD